MDGFAGRIGKGTATVGVGRRLGSRSDEVPINVEKLGERLERSGKRPDSWKRLLSIIGEEAPFHSSQPENVKQPEVPGEHVVAKRCQRIEPSVTLFVGVAVFLRLGIEPNIDDQVLARLKQLDLVDLAYESIDPRRINEPLGKPDHDPSRSPIGEIQMQVEPALHQLARLAVEIAKVVYVCESCGRYVRSRREPPQRLPVRLLERSVDRLELVVLVCAHVTETLADSVVCVLTGEFALMPRTETKPPAQQQ